MPESAPEMSIEHAQDAFALAEHEEKSSADLFRQQVKYVREFGDALDGARPLETWRTQLVGPVAGSVVMSHIVTLAGGAPTPVGLGFGALNALIVGMSVHSRSRKIVKEHAAHVLDADLQEKLHEQYELWRVENKVTAQQEVVMHWQGTYEHEKADEEVPERSVSSSLRLITKLAEDNDIKAVLIAPETLKNAPVVAGFAIATIDLLDWAREQKKSEFRATDCENQPSKHPVHVFSPTQLRLAADSLETHSQRIADIKGYVEVLREYAADHPLVRTFDEYAASSEVGLKKIAQVARHCVERRLDDVAAIRTYTNDGTPNRAKVHLRGSLSEDLNIHWQHHGQHFDSTDLHRFQEMNIDDAHKIIDSRAVHPAPDIIRAAELLVAINDTNEAQDTAESYASAEIADENIASLIAEAQVNAKLRKFGPSRIFKRAEGDFRALRPTKLRKQILAGGMLAVAGSYIGAAQVDYLIRTSYDAYAQYDQQAYAKSQGLLATSLTDQEKQQATNITQQSHPFTAAYASVRQHEKDAALAALDQISGLIDDSMGDGEKLGHDESLLESNVGNVSNPNDQRVEWNIEPIGPIDTAGYWSQAVGDSLNRYGTWQYRRLLDEEVATSIPKKPELIEAPLIKVDGRANLVVNNMISGLPVLDGTDIVAANIQDLPVTKSISKNGSPTLRIDEKAATKPLPSSVHIGNSSVRVTYWLQASASAPRVKFVPSERLARMDPGYLDGYYPELRKIWENKIGTHVDSDAVRLQAEVDYVKNHFTYAFQPLDDKLSNSLARGNFNALEFSKEQLNAGTANCNVAATLVALDNSQTRPVWGFANNGDDKLVTAEGHMWLVDTKGNRYDPTPTKMAVTKAAEPTGATIESFLARKELLAALGLGGLAFALRRPLRRRYARIVLGRTSLQDLQITEATVQNVLYARKYSPDAIHSTARKGREDYLAQLAQPTYHEKETQRAMHRAQKQTTPAGKRALRSSARILRLVRQSQRLVSPLAIDDVHSVL